MRTGDSLYYGDLIDRSHPLNRGLVAEWSVVPWYKSGPRWIDLAGNRIHGTLTSGPTWEAARGRPGGHGAVGFSANYVDIPTAAALSLTGDIHVSAWIRPTATAGNGIFEKTTNGAVNSGYLFFLESNVLKFRVCTSGGQDTAASSATIPADTWTFVEGRLIGTDLTTWINGKQDGTGSLTGTPFAGNNISRIGMLIGVYSFAGMIDAVAVRSVAPPAGALYEESRRGNPSRWKRVSTRVWDFGVAAAGGGGATGHYYRHLLRVAAS